MHMHASAADQRSFRRPDVLLGLADVQLECMKSYRRSIGLYHAIPWDTLQNHI